MATYLKRKEKKRKDYTFRHQLNEKPGIVPGCPVGNKLAIMVGSVDSLFSGKCSYKSK